MDTNGTVNKITFKIVSNPLAESSSNPRRTPGKQGQNQGVGQHNLVFQDVEKYDFNDSVHFFLLYNVKCIL